MAKVWQPQPKEVVQSWIDAILEEASDELNERESKFVDDMRIRLANNWRWTEAQENWLESIYAAKTK